MTFKNIADEYSSIIEDLKSEYIRMLDESPYGALVSEDCCNKYCFQNKGNAKDLRGMFAKELERIGYIVKERRGFFCTEYLISREVKS